MNNTNKDMKIVSVLAVIFAIWGALLTYKVYAGHSSDLAYVDIQRVVLSAKETAAVRDARQGQITTLQKMAEEANKKIDGEKDEAKKKELSAKYMEEIQAKKAEFDRQYASELQALDNNIKNKIQAVASKQGYNVVLSRNSFVQGGEDLTDAVVEMVR